MASNEVEYRIGQNLRVVDASAWPWFRDLTGEHGQPGRRGGGLLFEFAQKDFLHLGETEGAHGRANNSIIGRREDGVEFVMIIGTLVDALCKEETNNEMNELNGCRQDKALLAMGKLRLHRDQGVPQLAVQPRED